MKTHPLLSSCAKLWKQELLRQSNDLARFFARNWLWPAQRQNPFDLGNLPEVHLGTAEVRFQAARVLHCSDLPSLFLDTQFIFCPQRPLLDLRPLVGTLTAGSFR